MIIYRDGLLFSQRVYMIFTSVIRVLEESQQLWRLQLDAAFGSLSSSSSSLPFFFFFFSFVYIILLLRLLPVILSDECCQKASNTVTHLETRVCQSFSQLLHLSKKKKRRKKAQKSSSSVNGFLQPHTHTHTSSRQLWDLNLLSSPLFTVWANMFLVLASRGRRRWEK